MNGRNSQKRYSEHSVENNQSKKAKEDNDPEQPTSSSNFSISYQARQLMSAITNYFSSSCDWASTSRGIENFVSIALKKTIEAIDLSNISFENSSQISKIKSSLTNDRIYKFVMSTNSPKFELFDKSFEWTSIENAVEVYKLPDKFKWPTMFCQKQNETNYFPEFIIRRMNKMHRHRVNATLNRLWYNPGNSSSVSDPVDSDPVDLNESGEMILWGGSPGSGISIAVNEIILECILKLNELGISNNGTPWQFFVRIHKYTVKFFYDSKIKTVSHNIYEFINKDLLFRYLTDEYRLNYNSFVIYEMDEIEICPIIEMPFLITTSCRCLEHNFKSLFKSSHSTYLYDPMLHFEFKFFMDVCFAFSNREISTNKNDFLDRYHLQGGMLRKILCKSFEDPVKAVFKDTGATKTALQNLAHCSPLNVNSNVNSIIGVNFDFQSSIELDESYHKYYTTHLSEREPFFPIENIICEYYHMSTNWRVDILSDYIGIAIGKNVIFPASLYQTWSYALFQVQELVGIYGGILKYPGEIYQLEPNHKMSNWTFYKCNLETYSKAIKSQKKTTKIHPSLSFAPFINGKEKESLIKLLPDTTKMLMFQGQHLNIPFRGLSPTCVYKPSVHYGPVFDALTAKPANNQLFLFQMTLDDLLRHPIKICAFNKVLSNLEMSSEENYQIYLFMIISAHDNIGEQHFFRFVLASIEFNACYLNEYASPSGRLALKKVVTLDKKIRSFDSELISDNNVLKKISAQEKSLLMTIGNVYRNNSFYKFRLSAELHAEFTRFLDVAPKIFPYICRAEFMRKDATK